MKTLTPMHTNKAFTLIELLIVIAIIGILAGVVLVSTNNARQKAKDTVYISHVTQITKLVENANALGLFNGIISGTSCLGDYGGTCWGASAYPVNSTINNVLLQLTNSIPPGVSVPSPSTLEGQNYGTLINVTATYIRVYSRISNNPAFCRASCVRHIKLWVLSRYNEVK